MSGGYFDYAQHGLDDIADEIEELIESNDDEVLNDWGEPVGLGYSEETIEKFKLAVKTLRMAGKMVNGVDLLVSGDDGEESFHSRWEISVET